MGSEPRRIKSIELGCRLLDELKKRDGARIKELAKALDRSEPTIHTYLNTLKQQGYVEKDGYVYKVSLKFLPMGEFARNREELYLAGRDEIDSLADETGEYVHLITAKKGRQIKLYESYGDVAVATAHHTRQREFRQYLHRSAAGKAILAEYPADKVDQIIDEYGLEGATENTITDRDALLNELDSIRERGYAVNDQELTTGLRSVGASIVDPENHVRARLASPHHLSGVKIRSSTRFSPT
ncbi:IclR family transcriptional regulator [Haloferax sp. ATB1]|uniref:IclR family transcriptional regulator n=1 Tax=Haloferax sp. ATB1 TaxID=1508454 RepID=UPI0006944C63|nr:IclR family transcriptional regulator [Haloferax sp. ATB1]